MQEKSKKRIPIKTTGPILIFSILGFAFPMIAKANILADALGSIGKDILLSLMSSIQTVLNWLLKASAIILEGVLDIGFNPSIVRVAQIGWTTTRDFANMFFILFMIIIAFATILRTEQYGAKKLLPKVILIALLINFSFVICSVIIDFSNISAKFFIEGIKNNLSGKKEGIITATFSDSLNMTGALTTYTNCEDYRDKETRKCNELNGKLIASAILRGMPSNLDCIAWVGALYEKCKEQGSITVQSDDKDFLNIILAMTVGSLVMLIAAFTFLAGAIMLLIRIVALWLLIVIVPLAFICHIMPGLSSQWRKWWDTFLKWCFFAPIYTFFIWMAIQIAVNGANQAIGVSARKIPGDMSGPITNPFVADPGAQFISYGIMIAFLLGGLIVAQKLGIAGANTVMAVGQKWAKGATDWAKRTAMRPAKAGGRLAGATTMGLGAKLFKGTMLGRRMGARAAQIKQAAAQTAENKKYANLLNTMTDEDIEKEIKSALRARKLIAVQAAKKRGILREANRTVAEQAMKTMRGYGDEEGARSLEELRPDAVKDLAKQNAAIERAIKEGAHKKWSKKVFEGPEGVNAMEELRTQLGTGELTNVFKGWGKDIKEQAEEALRGNFTDDFNNKNNIDRRNDFAKVTGKAYQAFYGDKTGTIQANYKQNPNANKHAKEYIQRLNTDDFGNLKTDQDTNLTAQHMLGSQVYGAGTKISGKNKNQMKITAQTKNPAAYKIMRKADTWKS